ncbi:MAG: DNA mismatch repair protein MutS [Chloroflexi bacterium]|nr:DNA mismatch repair protein MutS [Chloroflexota bacterium]
MKVLLLYSDRDLDPEQPLPPNADDLVQDLELNTLFNAMAQDDAFVFDVVKQVVLSGLTDRQEIRYRQDILRDCLQNAEVIREIYQIPIQAIESKRGLWLGIFGTYPGSILGGARDMLKVYVGLLKELKRIADAHADKFESAGFRRFFVMIQQELEEGYLAAVEGHLKALEFRGGALVSAELGKGNEGMNYVLRQSQYNGNWLQRIIAHRSPVYSYTLPPRDSNGARALEELKNRGISQIANAVAQAAEHVENFLNILRLELASYIGCLNLAAQLSQLGEAITFPEPAPASQRRLSCKGLYDVTLALTIQQKVVGNDVAADGKELIVITGANQGGKSTFLRSIGLAQLMMQCGMFVPAESFSANLCRGLFTHYKREEDASMESGKLDEELGRMSAIVDALAPDAMGLFNESFAATNEHEGSEIARQIVSALLERRIKVFFVTHLYEFAHGFLEKEMGNAIFLRAERKTGGERTFKLLEGAPLPTSYGPDLYHRIFEAGDQSPTEPEASSRPAD